jgi:NAD(P)-dependent dehydrogenase (short-subunit alcohol dehydrogenase family)
MKNIFITGVSSGIGHALATYYLSNGYSVYAISRREPRDLIANKNLHFISADLKNFESIKISLEKLFHQRVHFEYGFLNAGELGNIEEIVETDLHDIKDVMDINVWANKIILDYIHSSNIKFKQIIAISSGASKNGNKGWGSYSLSKATLNMLIKLYSHEIDAHMTALAPGLVYTDMFDSLLTHVDMHKYPSLQKLKQHSDNKNVNNPSEIAYKIDRALPLLLSKPSGEFIDLRDME